MKGSEKYFENIIKICNKTTSSNVSHQMSIIYNTYNNIADKLEKFIGINDISENLRNIVNIAQKTTSGNVSHNIATIKGICNRNIAFIKELESEEVTPISFEEATGMSVEKFEEIENYM